MWCRKCGKKLFDGSCFCPYCGTQVSLPAEEISPQAEGNLIPSLSSPPLQPTPDPLQTDQAAEDDPYQASPQTTASPHAYHASVRMKKDSFCSYCGHPYDLSTRKCIGCGKRRPSAWKKAAVTLILLLLLAVGYLTANYFSAVSAMNRQDFTTARGTFSRLLIEETLFPDTIAYVEAGVLMEQGDYLQALQAFTELEDYPVPNSVMTNLEEAIYAEGQKAYQAGEYPAAKPYFEARETYRQSADYLILIDCHESTDPTLIADTYYNDLVRLLGFEDASEILIRDDSATERFLTGRWESGDIYFELTEEADGFYCGYNLPTSDSEGEYYYISAGIYYSCDETDLHDVAQFLFFILDEDTINVYCYSDGNIYTLYRQ